MNLKGKLLYLFSSLFKDGIYCTFYRIRNKLIELNMNYMKWLRESEHNTIDIDKLVYQPKISIVFTMDIFNKRYASKCISSIISQQYTNWELHVVGDELAKTVKEFILKKCYGKAIKVLYYNDKSFFSSINKALKYANGEYVVFIDGNDILTKNSLLEIVVKLNIEKYDLVYGDEDKISKSIFTDPFFKPDWSPDTLMSFMYIGNYFAFRKEVLDGNSLYVNEYEYAWKYDFILRFTEKTDSIGHICKILYHSRIKEEYIEKFKVINVEMNIRNETLRRRGLKGVAELSNRQDVSNIVYDINNNYLVSIIIPSKDNNIVLERCIKSIKEKTEYNNYEIIVVDNGSNTINKKNYEILSKKYDYKYIHFNMIFNFSAMCNIGSKNSNGEYILFLNDDIEIIDGKWLQVMLGHAQLCHIGAVGAKLLYPHSTNIQHVGVVNLPVGPSHAFAGMRDEENLYFGRNKIEYNYIAVTGACILINRKKYNEVNGFDEKLSVAYNDIDLCFKLYEKGYYNVVREDVVLFHHESLSRGFDYEDKRKTIRLNEERGILYSKHPEFMYGRDPFYNNNLTRGNNNFSFKLSSTKKLKYKKIEAEKLVIGREDIVNGKFEVVYIDGSYIDIEGWIVINYSSKNSYLNKAICFRDERFCYILQCEKVYRKDITNYIGMKKDVLIGFRCSGYVTKDFSKMNMSVLVNRFNNNYYQMKLNDE